MIFDYETFKIIWWLFLGVLLVGFVLTAGFDLGVGTLLTFLGKKDEERRVIINSIGPTWEGNQIWLVLGAGAIFAAWPLIYAASFSGFYMAMMLALFALVLKPAGFKFRSKVADPRWRNVWDWVLFVGGVVPAIIFGVAFGNLLQGVPFHYDDSLRSFYTGSFFGLLNPFGLLAGLVSLTMLVMHGAAFLLIKTEGEIYARAKRALKIFGIFFIVLFALGGVWVALGVEGYRIVSMPDPNTSFTPLQKTVEMASGAWMINYKLHPWMVLAPIGGFVGALAAMSFAARDQAGRTFIASAVSVSSVVLTAGFAMFPFMMPSSSEPNHSLTVWDSGSSHLTLSWMFWVTIFFLPIVIAYTSWVFHVVRGKVTAEDVRRDEHTVY
jgi:cytochrome d ubiquinol oxidase subunit II